MVNKKVRINFILIFGIILVCSTSLIKTPYVVGDALPYIETKTSYTEQLIVDPTFEKSLGQSPWSIGEEGDKFDMEGEINGGQANLTIIGYEENYTVVNDIPNVTSNWLDFQPGVTPPDSNGTDDDGCWAEHTWDETGGGQPLNTPHIQWKKNVTMPVNMTDYEIISANLSTIVNATVDRNVDIPNEGEQGSEYDYVIFYVKISDIDNNIQSPRLAENRTSVLGIGDTQTSGTYDTMNDTYLEVVDPIHLIHYLESVLTTDYRNFTITIGIDIYCDDNIAATDHDHWTELRFKSINLSINFKKKINQLDIISLDQIGNSVNSSDYNIPESQVSVEIDEAKLYFGYMTDQNWTNYTLNSEIRSYINGTKIPETVKLYEANSTWQNASDIGFDITSLIQVDKNVSLSLKVYLADEFLLDINSTISIDNVYINVSFTVTVKTDKIQTILETVDKSISYSVPWNDTFIVNLNYTKNGTGEGILNANFTITWIDTYDIQEVGGGIYDLTCNNTNTISGQSYTLEIFVDDFGYIDKYLQLELNVIERETHINVFMDEENVTISPVIELPIKSQLNVTSYFFDTSSSVEIMNATVSLYGIDQSYYSYSELDDAYQFIINTEKLGIGTHLVSLVAEKTNYQQISELLRITVARIQTNLTTSDGINSGIITYGHTIQININYTEIESKNGINNANFTVNWVDSFTIQNVGNGMYQITCNNTNTVSDQTYTIDILVDDNWYIENSLQYEISITKRAAFIDIFMDGLNMTISPVVELPITSILNISTSYYDSIDTILISNASVNLYGLAESSFIYTQYEFSHQFMLDTLDMGLGTYLLSLVAQTSNYHQVSKLLRITIVPITTNGTIGDDIQAETIFNRNEYLLEILLKDEFDEIIRDCNVTYTSDFGSGDIRTETLIYNESTKYYEVLITGIPVGVFDIYIDVNKGPNYIFDQYRITLTTIVTNIGNALLTYLLITALFSIVAGFTAYQLYFKYPPLVRDIRKVKRRIRRGKKTYPLKVMNREDIVNGILLSQIKSVNLRPSKLKKPTKTPRTEEDIEEIIKPDVLDQKPTQVKEDKDIQIIKPAGKKITKDEILKEKQKEVKIKKTTKKMEMKKKEDKKKHEKKIERQRIAQEKAKLKKLEKEKQDNTKRLEKEKLATEKMASKIAEKEKKMQLKEEKEKIPKKDVVKKEKAKVKISKVKAPKKGTKNSKSTNVKKKVKIQMPKGYVITRWTDDHGLIVESRFPEDLPVDLDDMMRVFYAHITGTASVSRAGTVVIKLTKSASNVSSYFTGMNSETPIMINLILELGEDPDMYGDAVILEINDDILKFFRQGGVDLSKNFTVAKKLTTYLKNALFLLDRLKNMTKGQRMASIYSSEKGRAILESLQERPRSRSEIQNILEKKFGQITSNLDITLDPFIKSDLIKQDWIADFTDVFLFLMNDFTVSRIPCYKLIEQARQRKPSSNLAKKYLEEVNSFFSGYEPNQLDNFTVTQNMLNPDKFDYISLFREKSYPVSKIPKSSADAFRDVGTIFRAMEKDNIIKVIMDDKTQQPWIFLLSDISVKQFYPEYLLEKIRQDQMDGKLNPKIAVKHLDLLEKTYSKEVE